MIRFRHRLLSLSLLVALATSGWAQAQPPGPIVVRADFPGGSILVEELNQADRIIRFLPGGHPERGFVAWWYFKLEGLEVGSEITLDVGAKKWAQPDQAQFSHDNRTWHQLDRGESRNGRTVYRHKITATETWFAWGPPFVFKDAQELVDEGVRRSPHATAFELARSRGGRPVPGITIAEPSVAHPSPREICILARQHAWEAGSSWVARGLVEWLISDDPQATALRQRARIHVVPLMDVDNVETGAGGKNQKPRDHYWDWDEAPIYPEVRAAMMRILAAEATGRLDLVLDLHNPGPRDFRNFFYIPAQPLLATPRVKNQESFFQIAKEEITGPMGFTGHLGPTGATYDPVVDTAADCWVALKCRPEVLALVLETPWNTPTSTQVGYRQTGVQLGRTIERYLRQTGP